MSQARSELTRSGLPFWAAAFVGVACLALIGLCVWHQWLARRNDLQVAEIEMANLAHSLTQHADDTFNLAETIVTGLVSRLEASDNPSDTIARIQQFLQQPRDNSRIRGIFVYDETGRRIAATGHRDGSETNADRGYFLYHLTSPNRGTFIGPPLKSRTSGLWLITVSRRINHSDGSFAGVVVATVDVASFAKYYRQFDVGESGSISLISNDGIMLARSYDTENFVGRDLSDSPPFRDHNVYGSLIYLRSSLDGIERLSFFESSRHYPVVVAATRAKDEVLAPWWRITMIQCFFVLGLVMLIATMGVHLIRRLMERQRMATALIAKEADFRLLAEQSSDVVIRIGADERIIYASPSCTRILGWTPEQLQGKPALGAIHEDDLARAREMVTSLMNGTTSEGRMVYRKRHQTKGVIWLETALRATRHSETGQIDGIVGICRDITEQKAIEHELDTKAHSDALTGLANRRQFDQTLTQEWTRAKRDGTELGLLLIDVDYFKRYNDHYGHQAGDECLRTVAFAIAEQAQRPVDLAARYGGEEFALLLPNTDDNGCWRVAERIRNVLYQLEIEHAGNTSARRVTVSVGGAAIRPADVTVDASALVGAADAALYLAKNSGRNEVRVAGQTILPEAIRRRA